VGSNPAWVDFFIIIFIAILTKDFGLDIKDDFSKTSHENIYLFGILFLSLNFANPKKFR